MPSLGLLGFTGVDRITGFCRSGVEGFSLGYLGFSGLSAAISQGSFQNQDLYKNCSEILRHGEEHRRQCFIFIEGQVGKEA